MTTILLVIQVIIAMALIGVVLIQRSDGDGLGIGGSGGGLGLLSGRGKASALTRATAILATLFMLNSLLLGVLTSYQRGSSIADRVLTSPAPKKSEPTVLSPPVAEEAPAPVQASPEAAPANTDIGPVSKAPQASEPAQSRVEPQSGSPAEKAEPITPPTAQ